MIKAIAIAIAAVIALALLYATTRPDTFALKRSLRIAAPPEKIYPLIADLRAFDRWNPFARKDPKIQLAYSGAASGVGTVSTFSGNRDVGKGSVEIVGVQPVSSVTMKLSMLEPMAAVHRLQFTLQPDASGTVVTWAMDGPVPYIGKLVHMVLSMDKLVGGDFEAGLANLKSLAEQPR